MFIGGLFGQLISDQRLGWDLEQLNEITQQDHRDETKAEIAGDLAGREAGEWMQDALSGKISGDELKQRLMNRL